MSKGNLAGTLTIARRAGKLTLGLETTKNALNNGIVVGILLASDASPRTIKEARFFATQGNVPWRQMNITKAQVGSMIRTASGVIGVTDAGFWQSIEKILTQEENAKEENVKK